LVSLTREKPESGPFRGTIETPVHPF